MHTRRAANADARCCSIARFRSPTTPSGGRSTPVSSRSSWISTPTGVDPARRWRPPLMPWPLRTAAAHSSGSSIPRTTNRERIPDPQHPDGHRVSRGPGGRAPIRGDATTRARGFARPRHANLAVPRCACPCRWWARVTSHVGYHSNCDAMTRQTMARLPQITARNRARGGGASLSSPPALHESSCNVRPRNTPSSANRRNRQASIVNMVGDRKHATSRARTTRETLESGPARRQPLAGTDSA